MARIYSTEYNGPSRLDVLVLLSDDSGYTMDDIIDHFADQYRSQRYGMVVSLVMSNRVEWRMHSGYHLTAEGWVELAGLNV